MAPTTQFFKRGDITDAKVGNTNVPVIAVVGFGVAGALLLFVVIWISLKACRKRAKKRREDARGAAFLTVKGVMKESSGGPLPSDLLGINQTGMSYGVSRANITSSVVLPAKAVYRPGASREEIISYHEEQGLMPRPFAPFSFALNAAHGSSSSMSSTLQGSSAHSKGGSTLDGSGDSFMVEGKGRISIDKRISTQSFSASAARLHPVHKRNSSMFSAIRDSIRDSFFGLGVPNRPGSVMSAVSNSSSQLSTGGVQTRRVHQIFTPILPDEPTLAVGERVAVLRSFDDGWCVIGRDKLFGQPGDVELGTVPAWCFVKPMKGLKSERPVRSSSLGVTVQVDLDGPQKPRDDIISWSNF